MPPVKMSVLTFCHMRNEGFEGRRQEVLDEPELDGTLGVAQYRDDHEECHTLQNGP